MKTPQRPRAQYLFTQRVAFRQSHQETVDKARMTRASSSSSSRTIEEYLPCFECLEGVTGRHGGGNEPPRTKPARNRGCSSPSGFDDKGSKRLYIPQSRTQAPPNDPEASKRQEMEDMGEFIVLAIMKLNKAGDPGKHLPSNAPGTFSMIITKFRRC